MITATTRGDGDYIVSGTTQEGLRALIETQTRMERLSMVSPTVYLIYALARHHEIRSGM